MEKRRWMLAALILATGAVPLPGQERTRPREPGQRVRLMVRGDSITVLGDSIMARLMPLMQRRARLGVVVSLEARATDSVGAYIQSVTPGGPADKAGLRSGDLIARLDGESLLAGATPRAREGESVPGLRLVELAAKLEPDDTIAVEYVRDNARRTIRLVTGDEPIEGLDIDAFGFRFPDQPGEWRMPGFRMERVPAPERFEVERLPGGERRVQLFFGGPLSELELAPMNTDLGWYFGTTEGVLVLRTGESSSLGVRPGDVILSVDGRKPSSAASLLRILRSYEPGESFRIEVMRQKQRQTVTGRIERRER